MLKTDIANKTEALAAAEAELQKLRGELQCKEVNRVSANSTLRCLKVSCALLLLFTATASEHAGCWLCRRSQLNSYACNLWQVRIHMPICVQQMLAAGNLYRGCHHCSAGAAGRHHSCC